MQARVLRLPILLWQTYSPVEPRVVKKQKTVNHSIDNDWIVAQN